MGQLPTGTVTFLFTDIEGSTRLWEADPAAMHEALAQHDAILRAVVEEHGGCVFATAGDGFAVAFARAEAAIAAAAAAQLELDHAKLPPVRMGVHTGEAHERDGDYFGPTVNRSARLMAIGHGGQVLLSNATAKLVPADLLRELGEYRLRDLSRPERVSQLLVPGLKHEFPALRSLDLLPTNLPAQSSRFIGRLDDLEHVVASLEQCRLVTLTGVGGVGKTRLALQAAAAVLTTYPDGVWLVELAGVTDPAMVAETVRSVLGVQQQPGRTVEDCVVESFSGRCLLIVLDNCEHVIDIAAALALRLVSSAGSSRILATSREGLAVPGERVVAVAPMAVPGTDASELVLASDAVNLFVDRAMDARDGFRVDGEDVATLAQLCRRLDGIPLAIELAAARVRSSTVAEILAHLDNRFRLLSAGRRTAPTRQQTLHNAIDWSHDLLDEPERMMLRRLSVFAGGFDLEAVEAVTADSSIAVFDAVELLHRLVDKSLVAVDLSAGTSRYRLLETIRDYGWERLTAADETVAFTRRHTEHFAGFSELAGAGLRGAEEAQWSALVDSEIENLRLALATAIERQEADLALRIVGGLAVSGSRVGVPFGAVALEAAELEGAHRHPARALALSSAAWSELRRGEYEQATELSASALRVAREQTTGEARQRVLCQVLAVAAVIISTRPGMFDDAVTLAKEREAIAIALEDHYEIVQALSLLAPLLGDAAAAEEALRLARIVANPTMLSYALSIVAMLITGTDPNRAYDLLAEATHAAGDVGNAQAAALAEQAFSAVTGVLGDHVSAARIGLVAAERLFEEGERFFAFSQLWGVASSLNALDRREDALVLGAWLVRHGAEYGGPSALPQRASVHLSDEVTPEAVDELDPRVANFSEKELIAFVRDLIAR